MPSTCKLEGSLDRTGQDGPRPSLWLEGGRKWEARFFLPVDKDPTVRASFPRTMACTASQLPPGVASLGSVEAPPGLPWAVVCCPRTGPLDAGSALLEQLAGSLMLFSEGSMASQSNPNPTLSLDKWTQHC